MSTSAHVLCNVNTTGILLPLGFRRVKWRQSDLNSFFFFFFLFTDGVWGGWGNVSAMHGTLSPLWKSAWSFVTSVSLWSSMQPTDRPANQCPGSLLAYCSWVWQRRACPASAYSLPCFSFSMWWHSFSAGPSFRPMYFMIMSLLSSIRAFPSISCRKQRTGRITLNCHRQKPIPAKANRPV